MENNFGKEDPYFETVPATRLNGTPSTTKTKKRRKALPPGISEHDAMVLTKVKRRAYRLDMSLFSCFGIRFGWSSVIGIIPAIGDVIDAFMAMMVLRTCQQVEGGLPAAVKSKMMFNIILDFAVGLVPFIGDIADAVFRANTRNAVELEKYLREKGAKNLKAHGQTSPVLDPTDPDEYDRQERDEAGPPPQYATAPPSRDPSRRDGQSSRPVEQTSGGGFFSKKRQPDVERGERRPQDGALPSLPPDARVRSDDPQRNTSTLKKERR